MSWLFSRALVEASLGVNFSDGKQSVPSSSHPTPQAYCAPVKMTDFSRLSRFGMTFGPSTEIPGEDVLTWCLAGSLARTSVLPEKGLGLAANDPAYGQSLLASLARFDPLTCSWRTAQSSLLADSDRFLETWPRWGSMRNGVCWERTTPLLPTCATEFGLWPTPSATDASDRKVSAKLHETQRGTFKHVAENGTLSQVRLSQVVKHRTPGASGRLNPDWVEWLMGWPIGHTALKPLATAKYQQWLRQHGASSEAA